MKAVLRLLGVPKMLWQAYIVITSKVDEMGTVTLISKAKSHFLLLCPYIANNQDNNDYELFCKILSSFVYRKSILDC